MSSDPFNSFGGFSVNIPPVRVIDANGNVVTNVLALSGNVAANVIYSDNYRYANGVPFIGAGPNGSNNQIQFNSNGAFGASTNFTFDTSTNTVQVNGNLVANTMQIGSGLYSWSKTFVHLANSNSNADQLLFSVSAENVSGAEFHIFATDDTLRTRESTKISSVIYDGQVQSNQDPNLYINGEIGQYVVQYNSGAPPMLQLRVTPDNNSQVKYKIQVTLFEE
jgi:hypothetical protein